MIKYRAAMDYIPRRTITQAVGRLSRDALRDRLYAMRALASVRGVQYLDDAGHARIIDIAFHPWLLTSRQLLFFHRVMQDLAGALMRLPALYAKVPAIREIIQFEPERAAWLELATNPRSRPLAGVGRLDATAIFDHARWRTDFRMLEPNAVGVGGIHYASIGSGILLDVMGDVLTKAFPGRTISPTPDPRQLLVEELTHVARRLGRPLRTVALIENTEFTTGTDEFTYLAQYLTGHGVRAFVVDPRQLRLRRGCVSIGQTPIDLVYRDCELQEFIDMEAGGKRLTALRQAIREGRLISGLHWEFDQKSAWEVFTDPRYQRYFTPRQRRLFREHVLWTRLVREGRVYDPAGRLVDLPKFILRRQRHLVLKPNALFGGEGVVLGTTVGRQVWERELHRALRGRRRYVVQELASVASEQIPLLEHGHVKTTARSTVSGFFFNSTGIGLVGRFSSSPVVNVSQGGGLIGSLWIH